MSKLLRRDVLLQALVLGALVLAMVWLVANVQSNLERQNINSGFGFLSERAGFGINQTLIDYSEDSSFARVLTVGLLNTLLVSVLGIGLATVLGFVLGVARLSSNWLVNKTAMVYVEIFRNVPLLLQIMFWYFGVLRNLPSPRKAESLGDAVFLSNRGIVVPALEMTATAWWYGAALAVTAAAYFWLRRRAQQARLADGAMQSIWRPVVMIAVAALAFAAMLGGVPFSFDIPAP